MLSALFASTLALSPLFAGRCLPFPQAGRRAHVTASDEWMFVDVRGAGGEGPEPTLPALLAPFDGGVACGEERVQRVVDGDRGILEGAVQRSSLMVRLSSAKSCVGERATIVRVLSVAGDAAVARIAGVGRCEVTGIVSMRPALVVRVRPIDDERLDGEATELAAALCTEVLQLWEGALASYQRVQSLRLALKLKDLGSASSAALLSVPLEQQLELRASAAADSADGSGGAALPSSRGIDESLAAGVSLREELGRAVANQPVGCDALGALGALDGGGLSAAGEACLLSFVALRLSTRRLAAAEARAGGAEDVQRNGELSASTDTVERLRAARDRLLRKAAELQAEASLLSLGASD